MAYTADDLVTAVRRRAKRPSASADGKVSDEDILSLANEEMSTVIVPFVLRAMEEYYIRSEDLTPDSNNEVRIPSRAVAGAVRDVTFVSSDGQETSLPEIALEDEPIFQFTNSALSHRRVGYSFRGDKIRILPTGTSGGTIRIKYAWRPGRLVKTTDGDVEAVTSVTEGASSTTLTVAATPADWKVIGGPNLDIVQTNPNFDLLLLDTAPSATTATSVTFGSTGLGVSAGDYIAETGLSPIVQCPVEVQPILNSATVIRVLYLAGDYEIARFEEAKLKQQTDAVSFLFDPRNYGETKKIVSRYSALRAGGRYRGGYGY